VRVTQIRTHPDFSIVQYKGAAKLTPDTICIIIEVGSLKTGPDEDGPGKGKIAAQLVGYMDTAGEKWRGELLGIGLLGNEACFVKWDGSNRFGTEGSDDETEGSLESSEGDDDDPEWFSIFDPRFSAELEAMRDYCLARHSNL
jgi:hypothetical protein